MSAVEKSKIKIGDEQSCIIERLKTNKEMKCFKLTKEKKEKKEKVDKRK